MKKEKHNVYVADFETVTTNTKYFQEHQDTKVILYCVKKIGNQKVESVGTSIEQFWEFWKSTKKKEIICYFHNLDFDGDFILKFLAKKYKAVQKRIKTNCFMFNRQGRRIYKIRAKTKHFKITFMCSLKILSVAIEQLGKSYNIKKYENEENQDFYDVEPQEHVFNYPKTYVDYCIRDVEILRLSLFDFFKNMKEFIDSKTFIRQIDYLKKYTIGSIAYKLQQAYVSIFKGANNECYKGLKINFKTYEIASKLYWGGFTQFNPQTKEQLTYCENGIVIDINSAHPSSMTRLLPYGELFNWKETQPEQGKKYLVYLHLKIESARIKKPEFIVLRNWIKKGENKNRYVTFLNNFECYYLEEEFNVLKEIYDFKGVKILNKYWAYADYFLKQYVEDLYFYKEKYSIEKDDAKKQLYKTALNSSYGKHGTRADFDEYLIVENEQDYNKLLERGTFFHKNFEWKVKECSKFEVLEKQNILKLEPPEVFKMQETKKLFNRLIAATITAYSRIKIYKTAIKLGLENFLYCDTDSLFLKNVENIEEKIDLHDSKLGYWSIEKRFKYFITKGAKSYIIFDENKEPIKKRLSGVNKKYLAKNIDLATFETPEIFLEEAKLAIQSTKSGIVLVKKDLVLKERTN